FLSYRDPETSKTFEVFENVVDFIKNDLDMSPSGIERLIPGVIKDDDGPYYPTTIIFLIFSQLLSGDTDWNNRRQKLREDILSLTKGDLLHAVDAVLEPGFKKKCVCTISNDMKIAEANQILKERGEKPLKIKSL
ncbi:MAG: hypothetical protein K9M15_02665, partial [Candidatus Marinimicrobia bacterium]|nr:hypothetical protein [Candidatus Neomarinimicrobiota bacterium]